MSETEHPSAVALESLAAGAVSSATRAHVDSCAMCMKYVGALREEAAAFAKVPPMAFLSELAVPESEHGAPATAEPASTKMTEIAFARAARGRGRTFFHAAVPLALAATVLFVLRTPASNHGSNELPASRFEPKGSPALPSVMHLKGPPVLAVVRERAGEQARFTGSVAVAPNDRLRLELTVDRAGMYEAGLLGEDGSWLVLLAPTMLSPGAHYSEKAARLDDRPEPGFFVAGSPEDVARARRTRNFSGLAMVPVEVRKQ